MAKLLEMEWFKNLQSVSNLSQSTQLDISANLAAFCKTTTFQSGICSIIANLQTKQQDLAEIREMFLKLDTNNDGHLTIDELENGMKEISQIFHLEEPDVMDMLKAADVDGDGKIDYTEFIAAAYKKEKLLTN